MKPGEKLEIAVYAFVHTIEFLSLKKSPLVSQNKSNIRPFTVLIVSDGVFGGMEGSCTLNLLQLVL